MIRWGFWRKANVSYFVIWQHRPKCSIFSLLLACRKAIPRIFSDRSDCRPVVLAAERLAANAEFSNMNHEKIPARLPMIQKHIQHCLSCGDLATWRSMMNIFVLLKTDLQTSGTSHLEWTWRRHRENVPESPAQISRQQKNTTYHPGHAPPMMFSLWISSYSMQMLLARRQHLFSWLLYAS